MVREDSICFINAGQELRQKDSPMTFQHCLQKEVVVLPSPLAENR